MDLCADCWEIVNNYNSFFCHKSWFLSQSSMEGMTRVIEKRIQFVYFIFDQYSLSSQNLIVIDKFFQEIMFENQLTAEYQEWIRQSHTWWYFHTETNGGWEYLYAKVNTNVNWIYAVLIQTYDYYKQYSLCKRVYSVSD